MTYIMDLLIEYFRQYNVWFLALVIILQSNGLPVGANVLVISSGAFALSGELNLFNLWIQIWLFSVIGDIISYVIWEKTGNRLLDRFPNLKNRQSLRISEIGKHIEKKGKMTIILTRFPFSVFGPIVNVICGTTKYKFSTFVLSVIIGGLIWDSIYLGVGYWFGDNWDTVALLVNQFGQLIILISGIVIIGYLIRKTVCRDRCFGYEFDKKKEG